MFMEGEIDWVVVLGVVAAVASVLAVLAVVYAVTHRSRQVTTSGELDAVSKAREAAETRLYETLNAIPVALVQTDRSGKFVFANRAAHQLMGRRDAELIGLRFHSATWGITYPDGRPIPADLLPSARALRGQTVRGFQHVLANPSTRRKMLVSVTAMPIEDAQGHVTGSIAAMVETEGLIAPETPEVEVGVEAEIKAGVEPAAPVSDDLTRRVFEAATSALVVITPQGRVREANAQALSLCGDRDEAIGSDFIDRFLAEPERDEARQALLGAAFAPAGEAPIIISAGTAWRVLPLPSTGQAIDALLLAGDPVVQLELGGAPEPAPAPEPAMPAEADEFSIPAEPAEDGSEAGPTELAAAAAAAAREAELQAELAAARAQIEAERAEAVRAAEAARIAALAEADASNETTRRLESVGRLTGGVAQDFHALLSVMTSALDMMLKTAEDPSRVRRLGQAALAAGQRGEALTRRLSAFSQGENAASRALDVGVLLRALESRLRAVTGPGVDLMVETPAEPLRVQLDPVGFDGAVEALVRNAAEAMDGAGSIAVRLEALPEGGGRLTVRDTGRGLDEATAARALEPFFTTRPGAAGLGLAQVHAFARQTRGALSLTGAPGEGAEAALVLPAWVEEPVDAG